MRQNVSLHGTVRELRVSTIPPPVVIDTKEVHRMGGKSRKKGGVSKKLIDSIKSGRTTRPSKKKTSDSGGLGFDESKKK